MPEPGASNVVRRPRGGPQKAVIDGVSVLIESRDCSWLVDGLGLGGYGARGIERGERAGPAGHTIAGQKPKGSPQLLSKSESKP